METEKSRLGFVLESNEKHGRITTQQAEAALQGLIDRVINNVRQHAETQEEADRIKDVTINLTTIRCSKKFKPMMLIMPTSVLDEKSKDSGSDNEPSIFSTNKGKPVTYVKKYIFQAIKSFLYDSKDVDAFNSMVVKKQLGVNNKVYYSMKENRLPRLQSFDHGEKYVTCIIDPIRLFHYFVKTTDTESYDVEIGDVKQISKSNYEYELFKIIRNDKKRKKRSASEDKLAYELERRFVGFNGGR